MVRIKDLRVVAGDGRIAEGDQIAVHTVEGVDHYMNELRRRETERAEVAAYILARRVYWLAVGDGILAAVVAVAAFIAIVMAR